LKHSSISHPRPVAVVDVIAW